MSVFCKECGWEIKDGEVYFTPINKEGPLCLGCIEIKTDEEELDNSQFGVGE